MNATSQTIPQSTRSKGILLLIVLAALIFLNRQQAEVETEFTLPVRYENLPKSLVISSPSRQTVQVTLRGPENALPEAGSLTWSIDMSQAVEGPAHLPLTPDQLALPQGITLVTHAPEYLTLTAEKVHQKKVPIEIRTSGEPAAGFELSHARPVPGTILLTGPEEALAAIDKAFTKPVDIGGMKDSFKKEIVPDLNHEASVTATPSLVLAHVAIQEKTISKTIGNLTISGINTTRAYEISPPAIQIKVTGAAGTIEKIGSGKGIFVTIDLKGLKPGIYVRRATISLPVELSLTGVSPEIFTVRIR